MFNLTKGVLPIAPARGTSSEALRLAGTGTTEAVAAKALRPGKSYVLFVGAAGVRVRFMAGAKPAGGANVDPLQDIVYGPWTQTPFVPETSSVWVTIEAADGAAAYEAFIVCVQS